MNASPTLLYLPDAAETVATAGLDTELRILTGGRGREAGRPADEEADRAAQLTRSAESGPVHVLGVGRGVAVATALARRHPDVVRSLILTGADGWDADGPLGDLRVPTLVLAGDDRPDGLAAGQALADAISDATFVVLHAAGRRAEQEQPEAFTAWLHSFVQIIERLYGGQEATTCRVNPSS